MKHTRHAGIILSRALGTQAPEGASAKLGSVLGTGLISRGAEKVRPTRKTLARAWSSKDRNCRI
jgi:hypothetical protein